PELPPARADADRLRQVLLNLMENALKFTPADGAVTLTARAVGAAVAAGEGGRVALGGRDTGEGNPTEGLPDVFGRFYRADFARARTPEQKGGSGLGLAIARSLVEVQGGTIALASEVGTGTTVTIALPAWRAQISPPAPPPSPGGRGESGPSIVPPG